MDSCIFLAYLKNEQEVDAIRELFDNANQGNVNIVTSALTIAEVLNIQGKKNPIPAQQREQVRDLFEHEWINIITVTRRVAEISQELVWEHGVQPKDAIHVATAMIRSIEVFYSKDRKLLNHKTLQTEYGTVKLSVPKPAPQGKLL